MKDFIDKLISLTPSAIKAVEDFALRSLDATELSLIASEIILDFSAELQRAKKEITPLFKETEWLYLCDAFNIDFVRKKLHPVQMLKAQIDYADIYQYMSEKWAVKVSALQKKVDCLASFQGYAVHKSIEEWWHEQNTELIGER